MTFIPAEDGDRAKAEKTKEEGLMRQGVLDPEQLDFPDVLAEDSRDDPDALGGNDVFDGMEMKIGQGDLDERGERHDAEENDAPHARIGEGNGGDQREDENDRPEEIDV